MDPFATLAAELRAVGLEAEAQALEDAIRSGATGSECLGAAGVVLRELRQAQPAAARGALAPAIEACVREVRRAWPAYR